MSSAHKVDHNHTIFIFVSWQAFILFIYLLSFLRIGSISLQKKYSVQYYGNENTSVKYSIDILWHLYVYFVCVPCACMCVFLWMPVAHVHFSNLSDLCEPTAEEANTHAAFSITYNREFLPFHLATTLTTHWVSHTQSHARGHTHTHRKYFTVLSYAAPRPPLHSGPQHLLFHKPQQDSNSVPVHLYICVCLKAYVCVHP